MSTPWFASGVATSDIRISFGASPVLLEQTPISATISSAVSASVLSSPYTHITPRTCKELCHLATPLIYRTVNLVPEVNADVFDLKELCFARSRDLSRQIHRVGSLIREVSIQILEPGHRALEMDIATTGILLGAPQLQTLTITYYKYDFGRPRHSPLLDIIPRLSAVTSITFKEARPLTGPPFPPVTFDNCSIHVVNHFLAAMITHHGRNLRSIQLFGTLKIDQSLFVQLRDHAPNLQTLGMRRSLGLELSPLFREPKPWSCAATLRSLIVIQCGIHSEYLATQLALGTLGSIRHCSLFACGDPTDNQTLQTTAMWRGPPLDTFRVDHFVGWEVDSLSTISTRVLIATRVGRRHLINLMWKPSAFPHVAQLRISNKWSVEELDDLRRAAASRGTEVVTDWDRREDPGAGDFMLLENCPCWACREGTLAL